MKSDAFECEKNSFTLYIYFSIKMFAPFFLCVIEDFSILHHVQKSMMTTMASSLFPMSSLMPEIKFSTQKDISRGV